MLSIERIAFICIVKNEFSLSNELTGKLEKIVESRYNELYNNWMIDKNTIRITDIVLGTLLFLEPKLYMKILREFVNRLYSNEAEFNLRMLAINRYPEWLQRKGVTVWAIEKSRVLQMIGVKQ